MNGELCSSISSILSVRTFSIDSWSEWTLNSNIFTVEFPAINVSICFTNSSGVTLDKSIDRESQPCIWESKFSVDDTVLKFMLAFKNTWGTNPSTNLNISFNLSSFSTDSSKTYWFVSFMYCHISLGSIECSGEAYTNIYSISLNSYSAAYTVWAMTLHMIWLTSLREGEYIIQLSISVLNILIVIVNSSSFNYI